MDIRSPTEQNLDTDDSSYRLDLAQIRERLSQARGAEFWRSLEELAQQPEFEELLHREFPQQAAELPDGVNRRRFLQLMSASLALGGLTACTRQPLERIVPYVQQPEALVPGQPVFFATSMPLDGFARPLLVESHMGRPTKVEGNPQHPASGGATDLYSQASVLTLYDPERSQVVRNIGRIRTWNAFVDDTASLVQALGSLGDLRLRILTRTVTSPSLANLIEQVLAVHPQAKWHQYSPVSRDAERQGLEAAFGQALSVEYDLTRADVVVGLDSDFLTSGPGSLRYARDFASRRRAEEGQSDLSRFYAAESTPTSTGTMADHRLPVRASEIDNLAMALATAVGLPGASRPDESLNARHSAWVEAVAADLKSHRGRCVVVPGEVTPAAVHTLAQAMNDWLGNQGQTVRFSEAVEARPDNETQSLRELVTDMQAGEVDLLLILGSNPVYEAPIDLDFADAMSQVQRRIHLGLFEDETAELCHWHIPQAHYLESWGDARAVDGTVCFTQPLIEPLYGGKTGSEVLSLFAGDGEGTALDLLQGYWRPQLPAEEFDRTWRRWLHDGFITGSSTATVVATVHEDAIAEACSTLQDNRRGSDDLELLLRPDPTIYDGSFNNNAWLQECPKPQTQLTWDNAALIGPALAERKGLQNTQVVELAVAGRTLEVPVWVLPGHPDGCITLSLGYGRRTTGRVGTGTGFDAYQLRTAESPWLATGLELRPTDRTHKLASTQLHSNIPLAGREAEHRHLVRVGTVHEFEEEPDFAQHMGHTPPPELSLFPPVDYPGHAWGLSIDLSSCTGCNACVVACQAENNIPVVGKEMVARGREMHWIRIDRYFQGDLDDPQVHHQPVMCMHCEQAPCEPVCPVAATVHSDEGLNDMVYNRCVGTRYCSNNCPYKVRRFNFLKYNDTKTPVLKMLRNPDVTVRTRGVMEKCTYCVQRINHTRIRARTEDRPILDGEIQTACQQVCPSQAIVFGDINDPQSVVSKAKASPLSYGILEELGTQPRTSYLAKLMNPNDKLEKTGDDTA